MELTKEYFEQTVARLASREDLQPLATKADVSEAVESLARIIAETVAAPMERHFSDLKETRRLREDVETLKAEMQRIKDALRLSPAL